MLKPNHFVIARMDKPGLYMAMQEIRDPEGKRLWGTDRSTWASFSKRSLADEVFKEEFKKRPNKDMPGQVMTVAAFDKAIEKARTAPPPEPDEPEAA